MTIWFTSDTHFFHKNICKYTNRSVIITDEMTSEQITEVIAEMNAKLIANWNSVVQPDDTIWHLGDFSMRHKRDQLQPIFEQLHGKKRLIRGNHDDKYVFRLPWQSQDDYTEIKLDGYHIVLCHYAIVQWNRSRHGSIHLHGHHHGTLPPIVNRIDVGVDAQGLFPIAWDALKAKISHEPSRNDH